MLVQREAASAGGWLPLLQTGICAACRFRARWDGYGACVSCLPVGSIGVPHRSLPRHTTPAPSKRLDTYQARRRAAKTSVERVRHVRCSSPRQTSRERQGKKESQDRTGQSLTRGRCRCRSYSGSCGYSAAPCCRRAGCCPCCCGGASQKSGTCAGSCGCSWTKEEESNSYV